MKPSFENTFKTDKLDRDNFLARLFGIFSEEVVHAWCDCLQAPYENLGRPSIYVPDQTRPYTIDFTLRQKAANKIFIAEMKCWTTYQNYRYLRLRSSEDLESAAKNDTSFKKLLPVITKLAMDPKALPVRTDGSLQNIDGVILIWGAITENGYKTSIQKYGFADILSVETMLSDLEKWAPKRWEDYVNKRRMWCNELFNYLLNQ